MIKHVVLFKFKEEISAADKKEMLGSIKYSLEQLKNSINCLLLVEVGLNSNPNESYDLALTTIFQNWDDLKAYVIHPEHQEVSKVIRQNLDKRACVDYEI